MNADKLVAEWLLKTRGIRFDDCGEGEQKHWRGVYAELHIVINTQDPAPPTLNERLIDLLTDTLNHEPILRQMNAGRAIENAIRLIRTSELIEANKLAGQVRVVESGRDCDGVEYDGRVHVIDATLDALEKLHDEIAEYADGPFRLDIVAWDSEVEYTSRDLVTEAFENGHRHSIVSRFP